MPYGGPNDKPVPDHVPASKRAQWAAVWNKAHASCMEKGGTDCEAYAFRVANGLLKESERQDDMGQAITEAELIAQAAAHYTAQSPHDNMACKTCAMYAGGDMPCQKVANEPTGITAVGYCDQWMARDEAEPEDEYTEAVQITGPTKTQVFTESIELVLAEADTQKRTVPVVLIRPGWSKNGRYYPPAVLAKAVSLFEGTKAYANHPTPEDIKKGVSRSILEITGRYKDVQIGPQGELRATRHIFGAAGEAVWPLIVEGIQSGDPVIGLSINAAGKGAPGKAPDGKTGIIVEDIFYANSVDDVDNPAAGGGFEALVAGVDELTASLVKAMSLDELLALREDVVDRGTVERDDTALTEARDERTRAQQGWRAALQRAESLAAQVDTLTAQVSVLQGETDRSKVLLALEQALHEAHLLPQWEADIREQLAKAPSSEWMSILERERRKAQVAAPSPRVPVTGAPRSEQSTPIVQENAAARTPGDDVNYDDWRRLNATAGKGST